jgi:GDPmannose 4,6-dehydratase
LHSILVTGVNGQDGQVLLDLVPTLLPGDRLIGLIRQHKSMPHDASVIISKSDYSFQSLLEILDEYAITHVLHLAGLSSVSRSIKEPSLAERSIFDLTKTVASACVAAKRNVRLVAANSSEIFGQCPQVGATLATQMKPLSPYAHAKAKVREYLLEMRQKGVLDCGNLILFNHESKYRGDDFVVKKLLLAASSMKKNGLSKLEMGNLSMRRDWGDAYKYMHAAILFLLYGEDEQILCSGHHASIYELAKLIFESYSLNFDDVYIRSEVFYRKSDIEFSFGSPRNISNLQVDVSTTPVDLINRLTKDINEC